MLSSQSGQNCTASVGIKYIAWKYVPFSADLHERGPLITKMTGETPEVRSDKRKPGEKKREKREKRERKE